MGEERRGGAEGELHAHSRAASAAVLSGSSCPDLITVFASGRCRIRRRIRQLLGPRQHVSVRCFVDVGKGASDSHEGRMRVSREHTVRILVPGLVATHWTGADRVPVRTGAIGQGQQDLLAGW